MELFQPILGTTGPQTSERKDETAATQEQKRFPPEPACVTLLNRPVSPWGQPGGHAGAQRWPLISKATIPRALRCSAPQSCAQQVTIGCKTRQRDPWITVVGLSVFLTPVVCGQTDSGTTQGVGYWG